MVEESGNRASHPRLIGWFGTTALAMGGSNQSLFLIGALFAGQGDITGQGSAAVPLLILGLLLSYMAAPGWTELVLMSPDRVGGIAAACTAAFRPYSPILSTLTGTCYWWGWVPTCGVTALLSAAAIHSWVLPGIPVSATACGLVAFFTLINLAGIHWVTRFAVPFALTSAALSFVSMIAPVWSGEVDWRQATSFHLITPFPGEFGQITSLMAGLYLIGFGAPAFEAATCHVGETIDPARNVPRAVLASAVMAAVYFAALPVIWLGALGPVTLGHELIGVLGPTFAPLLGGFAKSAAIGFMMFNMFHGTLQPLAGAARTLSQLAEDGMAPRFLALRLDTDAPWVATLFTAGFAIFFLLLGDPIWLIAAANFTYLIGICMPSVAVWLLRRDAPDAERPYRAPRGTIVLGVLSAIVWFASALLGFEQFGLPTVVIGLLLAYSGTILYAWRKIEDRRRHGLPGIGYSLHVKLTGAMLLVLALDAAGYLIAVMHIADDADKRITTALADIFVAVALVTISVGIVLPGMIGHSAVQVAEAARRLARGTVRDFARAMEALGSGRLEAAHADIDIIPVPVTSRDELGIMAESFNDLQDGIAEAATGLDRAREGLSTARADLLTANAALRRTILEQQRLTEELTRAKEAAQYQATHDPLTGLPNRTLFLERLDIALNRHCRERGREFAVLFVDLDRFKIVNDSMGHLAGNRLLSQAAARIDAALRNRDRTRASTDPDGGGDDTLGRLSGDEFILLVSDIQDAAKAIEVGERVQDALRAPFVVDEEQIYISASIGIVPGISAYTSTETILRDADLAMYRAKNLGKSRAVTYEPAMHLLATQGLHMDNDLRRALTNHEFVLHYQPIMRIADSRVIGVEALIRWRSPAAGLVAPSQFIPIAEETGLIVPIGAWALGEACGAASRWRRDLPVLSELSVSVNLSARQFVQANLVSEIGAIIERSRIDPTRLTLEITESCTMGDPERAVRVLTQLKSLGLRISVDDFGTGYSSLSYLHRFPIDVLKIDRSFILDMNAGRESPQIVDAMIGLAHRLGMRVVAEGVETREHLDMLRALGCDFVQGYFLSRPLPECGLLETMESWPIHSPAPSPDGSSDARTPALG